MANVNTPKRKNSAGSTSVKTDQGFSVNNSLLKELLKSLQEIYLYAKDNQIPSYLNLPSPCPNYLKDIIKNGISDKVGIININPETLTIEITNPDDIDLGAYCTLLYNAVAYHLIKDLQLVSIGSITYSKKLPNQSGFNDDKIQVKNRIFNNDGKTPKANNLLPHIYIAFRDILIKNGFIFPKDAQSFVDSKFNLIFFSNFGNIGLDVSQNFNQKNSIIGTMYSYIFSYDKSKDMIILNKGVYNFDPLFISGLNSLSNNQDKKNLIVSECSDIFLKILKEFNIKKYEIIDLYVKSIFKINFPKLAPPKGSFLTIGDGSGTNGILDISNFGVSLLDYNFIVSTRKNNLYDTQNDTNIDPINITEIEKQKDSVYDYCLPFVENKNKRVFNSLKIGEPYKLSLKINGFDSDTNYHIKILINGVLCGFLVNQNTTNYTPEIPTQLDNKYPIAMFNSVSNSDSTIFYHPTNSSVIAIFDQKLKNLNFIASHKVLQLDVKADPTKFKRIEEISMLSLLINDVEPKFKFKINDLFDNDRFEIKTDDVENKFLTSNSDINHVKNLAKLLNDEGFQSKIKVYISLSGSYIGKLVNQNTVVSDLNYNPRVKPKDHGAINSIPSYYSKVRQSNGKVNYTNTKIEITIDSTASPLRSRLDQRLVGPVAPYDYNYSTSTNSSKLLDLNKHTWYGADTTKNPESFLMVNNVKIPVYNQVLTALRSIGTLEALFKKILIVASQDQTMNINVIKTNLDNILSSVFCTTIPKDGDIKSTELNKITYEDFKSFKWYETTGVQSQFSNFN
jgi:hypothetical protein